MAKPNSFANVGDEAIFQDRRQKNSKWQGGWKVVGVTQFENGVVTDITVSKDKTKRKLPLFDDKVSVFVVPPADEVKNCIDLIEDYPNLRFARERATDPPSCILFCVKCHERVVVTQTTIEDAELVLCRDSLISSKPSISDGYEKIACDCTGSDYKLEFDSY